MTNLLNDKFTPALLPEICAPRHALINLFNKAANSRLVYVSAPAGYGKTVSTLLWLKSSGRKSIWLGLDSYDNSISVFYKLIAQGVSSLQPENMNIQKIVRSPNFSSSPVEHTIELLSEFIPNNDPYVMVLDDMHLVVSEEISKSLFAVMKRLPKSFTVMILTRSEPSELIKSLAEGGSAEIINGDRLLFSQSEINDYFISMGRYLTPWELEYTHSVTEGWAIGVNAVAKSGQISAERSGERILSDYIKEQIWNKWDERLREFMLKTALVDEFDCELAGELTGLKDCQNILGKLCAENSFISYQGSDIYRYHHLFLDFLRDELEVGKNIKIKALYKHAAHYYREKDNRLLSLHYYLKSGDYKGIGPYFYSYVFDESNRAMEENIEYFKVFFGEGFPKKAFSEYPALYISAVWYNYVTGRHEKMEEYLDALYKSIPVIALKNPEYMEYIVLAHSVDHRHNFLTQVKRFDWIGRFVKEFSNGRVTKSIVSFTHNLPYMHRSNRDYCELSIGDDVIAAVENTFAKVLGTEWSYVKTGAWAGFAYERNDIKKALALALESEKCLKPENSLEGHFSVKILLHSIFYAMRKQGDSERIKDELEDLINRNAKYFLPNYEAYKTKFALWNADKRAASGWLDNYFVTETEHIEMYKVFQHFTTARAYIVLKDFENAMAYILRLHKFGINYRRPLDVAEAGTLKAVLLWHTDRKREGQEALEEVVRDMQEYGFIRIISDEGNAVLPILKRIAKKTTGKDYKGGLSPKYINEIILAAHEFSKQHCGIFPFIVTNHKSIKLSKQQRHMLSLLSEGYTNAMISEATGLKIPTIKTHTYLAYQKLGVNNAMDAVLKARELNLL